MHESVRTDPPAAATWLAVTGLAIVGLIGLASATSRLDPRQSLENAWIAMHPGQPLPPPCDSSTPDDPEPDPLDTLRADVDPAPGVELVTHDGRFGTAMFDARDRLLAYRDPECSRVWLATSTVGLDGTHTLLLTVDDASGNSTVGWDGTITTTLPPRRRVRSKSSSLDGPIGASEMTSSASGTQAFVLRELVDRSTTDFA